MWVLLVLSPVATGNYLGGERPGDCFTNVCLAFRRKGEGRELFLFLPFFNYLQLKVMLTPKWLISGWGGGRGGSHILSSVT